MNARLPSVRRGALGPTVALLLAVALPAWAQTFVPQLQNIYPRLNNEDITRMQAAAARLYEGRSIGTVERWRNPDSGNAGSVKLIGSSTVKGLPCRRLEYSVRLQQRAQSPSTYSLNWCKTEAGEWKIVEQPRRD
jgi:surface antigen